MKKTTLLVSSLFALGGLFAQDNKMIELETTITYPESYNLSRALSEIAAENPYDDNIGNNERTEAADKVRKDKTYNFPPTPKGPEYGNDPSSIQTTMGTRASMPPLVDWAGQGGGGYPPDPTGAPGLNHYVQSVNATPVKVFNKTTGANLLTTNMGNLFSPAVPNAGDPIVLYDKYADRWFLAQFAQPPSTKVYIAVSKTADPTGQYHTWTFNANSFPDYLKFSIWHDGYYMTSNEGSDRVYVFERTAMLAGSASSKMASASLSTGVSGQGASFFVPLPADADGFLPTSGPCPLVYPVDNAWGASTDGVMVKDLTVNWSSSSLSISSGTIVPTTAHDMSYVNGWNDIPQPGTSAKLDGIGGVATFRACWRKFAGYNTMVLAWGVKISATQRSIKWAELRQTATGQPWTKHQEGVYSPDTKSRWVPAISMNGMGDIGLSYARCSSTAGDYASCYYTGRLSTDPLGQMTIAETAVPGGAGTHSQTNTNRFGDYGQNSIDPSDDCTFWSTMEYLAGGSPKTRIWSYKLRNCTTGVEDGENSQASSIYNVFQNGNLLNLEASKLINNNETQVDLFDITGKIVRENKITPTANSITTAIDVTGLSTGTYLLRIGNLDYQKVIKVFVK